MTRIESSQKIYILTKFQQIIEKKKSKYLLVFERRSSVMRDLSITIVEEHTKRLSRNLALTQTRRRTITFENPPANDIVEITKPNSNTTIIRNAKASKSICTTTTSEKSLRPAKNPITSTITTTTVDVPYKNFKIWTDYDQEENLQLHIREQKPTKEAASDCRKGVAMRTI